MRKLVLVFLTILFVMACEKTWWAASDRVFWVQNNSNMGVSTLLGYEYPDTSIPDITGRVYRLKSALPLSKATHDFKISTWKELFEQLPNDTLSIFIFHADTVQKYNWQEIRAGYKVLKRIEISRDDLERLQYTIEYP